MNISGVNTSLYTQSTNSVMKSKEVDVMSSATKNVKPSKPDAISSSTVKQGGDHFFEATV